MIYIYIYIKLFKNFVRTTQYLLTSNKQKILEQQLNKKR